MTIAQRLHYLLLGNGWSLWHVVRPLRDRRERKDIVRGYAKACLQQDTTSTPGRTVVSLFEGYSQAGGLADRLRGIVSVYAECKRRGLAFRLHFTHPFDLGLFLQPAQYDWRIAPECICRDMRRTRVCVMRPLSDSVYTLHHQQQWMRRTFAALQDKPFHQIHIYTNASTSYSDGFGRLFNELFRPTGRLQRSLDAIRADIGGRYISVSMRFLSLLGDFEDTVDAGAVLTHDERQALIARCLQRIEALHRQYPGHRVLVNSDSQAMLAATHALPYVYTIGGNIAHLDCYRGDDDRYQAFEKTFLDFFTISQADAIYMIREHDKMRHSGFPHAAALIGGKECKTLQTTDIQP